MLVKTSTVGGLDSAFSEDPPDVVLAPYTEETGKLLELLCARKPVVQALLVAGSKDRKRLRVHVNAALGGVLELDAPLSVLAGRIIQHCGKITAARGQRRPSTLAGLPALRQTRPPRSAASVSPSAASVSPPAAAALASGATPLPSAPTPLYVTLSQRPLPPVRVVVVDKDVMRTGAIAEGLLRRGPTSLLSTLQVGETRWHLLRRFSPHAILLDERSLESAREWIQALRSDPYLRHVPLLVVPMNRLFLEQTGQVDLSLLVPLLLGLGAEETAFQTQLGPGRSLDMRLDQLGVTRLLECIAAHPRPVRLECTAPGEELVLHVEGGCLRSARGRTDADPRDAAHAIDIEHVLDWFLAHSEARLVITEGVATTPDVDYSLRNCLDKIAMAGAMRAPAPQVALQPAPPNRQSKNSKRGSRSGRTSAFARLTSPPRLRQGIGLGLVLSAVVLTLVAAAHSRRPTLKTGINASTVVLADVPLALEQGELQDTSERERFSSQDTSERERFFIPDSELPGCDVGTSKTAGDPSVASALYLKSSRHELVAGHTTNALRLMCKAALLDPAGPASEGLATLFLRLRSAKNARVWAEIISKGRSGQRVAGEILGDVSSQLGDVQSARSYWLSSLSLSGNDTERLAAVGRKLLNEASRARRGRDLHRAERMLRRAVTLEPNYAPPALSLAEVYLEQSQLDLAQRWADHVLTFAEDSGARLVLGKVAEKRGAAEEARRHYAGIPQGDANSSRARERILALAAGL